MDVTDTDEVGAGGKASLTAMAGAIMFVIGLVFSGVIGSIGFFFMVLGGFIVLASPVIWLVIVWENRSGDQDSQLSGDGVT